jgi:large subunit ribosomal protein L10
MRPEKTSQLRELTGRLQEAKCVFVLHYGGLAVRQLTELRRLLKPQRARVQVVKNTMLGRAARDLGWQDLSPFLGGPTAVITGAGDATDLAKLLVKFVKSNEKAAIKGACLDGQALLPADVDTLTKVPPREVMLAILVGTVAAPLARLLGVFNQKLLSLPYVLKAAAEKKQSQAA